MYQTDAIPLIPWLATEKDAARTLIAARAAVQQLEAREIVLIAVLSVKQETLALLGKFALQMDEPQCLAYLSPVLPVRGTAYQIAYLPYREGKADSDCLLCLSDVLRAVSEIVVTDVACNGAHKYKERRQGDGEGRQFAIVSSKDVYQIETKENKIELSKRVEFALTNEKWTMPDTNAPKAVRLDRITSFFLQYSQQFAWFLNSDKNWRFLSELILGRYRSERHLGECFALEEDRLRKKMFSAKEMATIENEVMSYAKEEKSEIATWIAQIMVEKLRNQNKDVTGLLLNLREQFQQRQAENSQDLALLEEEAKEALNQYCLPSFLSAFLLSSHEAQKLQAEVSSLREKEQILTQLVMERNNDLMVKAHKIDQLKNMLREFAEKAEEMKQNTRQLIELTQLYEQEKQRTWKLQLEVDSHQFVAKKHAEHKLALENEIQTLLKEKGDLLLGLQQLTSENLSLMTEREALKQETRELRDRVEESNQVEARALQSIENEAEIKVRLRRYENYVEELKQVFNSFKRLEVEKFNYVLHHNAQQFQHLQDTLRCSQFELRRTQARNKELTESLHCERLKLNYFERIYAHNYHPDAIPELSEENSATDREQGQNA